MEKNLKNNEKNANINEKSTKNRKIFGGASNNYNKKKKNYYWATGLFSLVLAIVLIGQIQLSNTNTDAFGNDTYIMGESVNGYSVERASQVVMDKMQEKVDGLKIQIIYQDKVWNFDENDFEIQDNVKTVVQNAFEKYKTSFLEQRENENNSKILNSLSFNNINNNYSVSLKSVFKNYDEKINEIAKEIEKEPENAKVIFTPNESKMFNIKDGENGIKMDKEKLINDLENQFLKTKDIKVYVSTISVEPEISSNYFENKLNLMSKFSTTLKDSQEGRRHNVNFALNKFNGKVVKAGEKISFNEITGPQTLEGGYKNAIVILNNKFVNGVGGGICQASTTLYNALVLANLEINEVNKHSLPVGYVELSLDAMVSEGYSDMIFTNNSDDDIYIKAYTTKDEAVVEVYGNSIEEGITIKRVAEFIGNIPHRGDKVQIDETGEYADKVLYKGEYYRVKYPREGYEAKAFKETYKDGKLISREQIRHEKYQPLDGLIIEGAKTPPEDYIIPPTDVEFIAPQEQESSSVTDVVNKVKQNNPTQFNLCVYF